MKQGAGNRGEGIQLEGDDLSKSNLLPIGRGMAMLVMCLFLVGERGGTRGGTATSLESRDKNMTSGSCSENTWTGTFSMQNCAL